MHLSLHSYFKYKLLDNTGEENYLGQEEKLQNKQLVTAGPEEGHLLLLH